MIAKYGEIVFSTPHETSWCNITSDIAGLLKEWNADVGMVSVQVIGSTGSVVSIECEDQLLDYDIQEIYKRVAPPFKRGQSKHEAKWNDGNAHSHIRAAIFGAQHTFNVVDGNLHLGKWQHVVFIEFDVQGRNRRLSIVFLGTQKQI